MDRVVSKVWVGCMFLMLVVSPVMSALSAGSAQNSGNVAITDGTEKSAGLKGLQETTGTPKDNRLAVSSNGAVDLKNQTKKVHVALSNASGLGRFTIGGYYNGAWQKLLYGYPGYGSTSYLTIRVENATAAMNYTNKDTMMDPYVLDSVHSIGPDAVTMKWLLPENITVQQTIRLVQDFARIEINATNGGNSAKKIGVRYYYDTQVANRDDAPIYIPGVGVKTTQDDYANPAFTYWKGYDHPTVPTVVSEAKISGEDATTPTKLQIDQYGSEQAWENTVSPGSPFSDSAVLTYWAPTDVAPAQTKQVVTYYGIGAPVVKGPFNISEILVDRIAGSYCPDEQVTIKVDVVSIGQTHEGLVSIDILDGSAVLYHSPSTSTGAVPANSAATVQFNWTAGSAACGKSLDIKASLLNSSSFAGIDEMTKTSMITVDPSCPGCAAASYKFELRVQPERVTTSAGGAATFSIELANTGLLAGLFNLTATGIPAAWFSLEKNATVLTAGEDRVLKLRIHVPDECNASGTYQLTVSATRLNTGEQKNDTAELIVVANPVIDALVPASGSRLGSCDLLVSWKTVPNCTTVLYLKSEADPEYAVYTGEPGFEHAVAVYGLDRNRNYSYFVMSNSTCGSSTSDVRTFFVDNGISFRQRTYSFSIERDYNQQIMVSVENTDSEPHDLLTSLTNPYEDLYVGFVGDGSTDNLIPLNPGERKDVLLVVHAQDATKEDYPLAIKITSTSATETLVDFATANIHVHIPDINFSIAEVSTDPITLIKKFKVTNYGDTLTDFSVSADDSIKNNVLFQPSMNHYNLLRGAALEFEVIPIFSAEAPAQLSSCPVCPAGVGAGGVSGTIQGRGAGVTKSAPASFSCPEGEQVRCVTLHNVGIIRNVNDWYCTNRPNISLKFDAPAGFGSANVEKATLQIQFTPFAGQQVEKHDVEVYLNGRNVGSLANKIPRGVSEFELNPAYLAYSNAGKAENKIELKTKHMNGGHYQVASNAVIRLCLDNLTVCVCAPSQEEAVNRAKQQGHLEPSPSSIAVTISEPGENQEVQTSKTVQIKASVAGDGSPTAGLAVTASFSNGDSDVNLASAGGGTYAGQWTVSNAGAPSTGECTITVRAATCDASGEATRKVKILMADALKVAIQTPKDEFIAQKENEVVISARVNYYTTSTKQLGGVVKNADLDSIEAEVGGSTIPLADTGKGAGLVDDGLYAGIWKPDETKEYTIKVTAKKSGLTDGADDVKGMVIARPELEIKPPPGCIYKQVDAKGETVIAPVFQRKLQIPDFVVTNLTELPARTKLIIEISEPQRGGGYKLVKKLEVSKNYGGTKLTATWDWSSESKPTRVAGEIPVGAYYARARLIKTSTNTELMSSEEKVFYVILDPPGDVDAFYLNPASDSFENNPIARKCSSTYWLHVEDPRVWKRALGKISGETKIGTAAETLTRSAGGELKYGGSVFGCGDVLKLLEQGEGVCLDYSGLLIAYSRAVGIPARGVSGYGSPWPSGHQWTELYYNTVWNSHDATLVRSIGSDVNDRRFYSLVGGITFGDKYPRICECKGCPSKNINDRYAFTMNLSPTFKPDGRIDAKIENRGTIDFDESINARFSSHTVKWPKEVVFDDANHKLRLDLLCEEKAFFLWRKVVKDKKEILPSQELRSGGQLVVDLQGPTKPGVYTCKFCLYYLPDATKEYKYALATLTKDYTRQASGSSLPRDTIASLDLVPPFWDTSPRIIVDSDDILLNEPTSFDIDFGDNWTYVTEQFIGPENTSLSLYRDTRTTDNFAKDKFMIENTDQTNHTYVLEIPYIGEGDTVYIPGFGEVTNDTSVNISTEYVAVYTRNATTVTDDTCATALPLTLGLPSSGTINPVGDVDWWKVDVPVTDCPQILNVTVAGPEDQDLDLYVYDDCETEYLCAPWLYGSYESCLINATPGTYYIKIEGYENSTGNYTLLSSITPNDAYCCGAVPVPPGEHASGWIEPAGDSDWWSVETFGGELEVNLYGPSGEDFDLYVFDSCDTAEPVCSSLGLTANETCVLDVDTGTYYIRIVGWGDSTGYYELWCFETLFSTPLTSQSTLAGAPKPFVSGNGTTYNVDVSPTSGGTKIGAELSAENITLFAFSRHARINNISFDDSFGTRVAKVMVSWDNDLYSRSTTEFFTYSQFKNSTEGLSFQELYENSVEGLQKQNNTFLSMTVSSGNNIEFNEDLTVNVTVENSGINPENVTLRLNTSKTVIAYKEDILVDEVNIVVNQRSANLKTFVVNGSVMPLVGEWDIVITTTTDSQGRTAASVHDAFELTCTHNITVEQYHAVMVNTTITNRWDAPVHGVNLTSELYSSFTTSEPVEKQLGTLLPHESRTISWNVTATSAGTLPFEVLATSADGGYESARTEIIALAPPLLRIPNTIIRTSAAQLGTNSTTPFTVSVENWGNLPAHNIQLHLLLPEQVSSTLLTPAIGNLSAGEARNVSANLTYSTQKDFAVEVRAVDDANHTATGVIMISQYGAFEDLFDTGPGSYPSIAGVHTGVIKPSHEINVSTLYTYPSSGTGGHTNAIKIYNESGALLTSGTWTGYRGDWHNLTLTPAVTLLEGHTYNFSIVTDSYPQIIHAPTREVPGGTITCTEFVDINGVKRSDWIPAIRLF